MKYRGTTSTLIITHILFILATTITLAQNLPRYDSAKLKIEAASDIVISKLVGYLPRYFSIIEPKLGQCLRKHKLVITYRSHRWFLIPDQDVTKHLLFSNHHLYIYSLIENNLPGNCHEI